ncbi:MAG: gamma-glutamyl-gamma-aminobutyrate hydrolase family protein [Tepidanaerobacter acetatoxydans]|uniref:gamma-glutamyl-gamma-aminobutyrate hydrolase family protein n=1 Tax=Tepidanaerobacter acetatoxydans TaxID=499229 RepID=UPI0026EBE055|nr:gamma-glutamyl-gamma-aminobutyrate hydrolase family protein [Tepidanaerobacter acetatoxydans]NLU09678.1 gamma-glutamyl-gamma-aminobutyrate hydrolase family protein [Tepidanaerobacter acetatoxydans]
MKKPIIGITCPWSVETWGDSIEKGGYYYAGKAYAEAVHKYGGIPILIAPEYDERSLDSMLDSILTFVNGVLFTGGGSVKRKSSEDLPTLRGQQPTRYDFEAALLKKAYEKEMPILGICRGFQMIIEVFGGKLSDEIIKNHRQNLPREEPWHEVIIKRDSKLYKLVGSDSWSVNSLHVQKAEKIPDGFIASAKAKDGVIECIEALNYPWLMGCQFHPEELSKKDEIAGNIFKLFIRQAESMVEKYSYIA